MVDMKVHTTYVYTNNNYEFDVYSGFSYIYTEKYKSSVM